MRRQSLFSIRPLEILSSLLTFCWILDSTGRALGALGNATIDDQYGDQLTGEIPYYDQFQTTETYIRGNQSTPCSVDPCVDAQRTFNGTYTEVGGTWTISKLLSFQFTGVAIYVFMTLPPHRLRVLRSTLIIQQPSDVWEPLAITDFYSSLDGEQGGVGYTHRAERTDTNFTYQFPVLAIEGLEHKSHRLDIIASPSSIERVRDFLNYVNFDYAVYTYDDTLFPVPGLETKDRIVGPIAGGVAGGVAVVLIAVCTILLLKRRRRAARALKQQGHVSPMNVASSKDGGRLEERDIESRGSGQAPIAATSSTRPSEKAQLQRRENQAMLMPSGPYERNQHGRIELRATRKQQFVPAAGTSQVTHTAIVTNSSVEQQTDLARPSRPRIDTNSNSFDSVSMVMTSTTGDQIQDIQATIDAILHAMDHDSREQGLPDSTSQDSGDEGTKERLRLLREKLRNLQGRLDEDGVGGGEELPGYESPKNVQGLVLPLPQPAAPL